MKKSFYIGFLLSFFIFLGWEIYLISYFNNYHPIMIPLFLFVDILGAYITGLFACGKIKMF